MTRPVKAAHRLFAALALIASLLVPAILAAREVAPRAARVLSWHDAPGNWDIPFAWADPRFQAPGLAAHLVAADFARREPGDRVLFLFGPLSRGNFPTDPARLVVEGVQLEPDRGWMIEFFRGLQQRGAVPDQIVLDIEENSMIWGIFAHTPTDTATATPRADAFRRVYDDPAVRAKLPESLRAFEPADFGIHTGRGRDAYIAWNDFAYERGLEAMRQAILLPAREAFGRDIPASNWDSINPARPVRFFNDWPMRGALTPDISSPESYPGFVRHAPEREKDVRWNRLIQILNVTRACLATPDQRVEPWVASPTFADEHLPPLPDPWLWEQLMRHFAASGVETYLFWNPRPTRQDFAAAKRWMDEMEMARGVFAALRVAPPQRDLPEIPFDADVIETGGVRTTYEEFLRRYPPAKPPQVAPSRGPLLPPGGMP
jgi:hypothetical protein